MNEMEQAFDRIIGPIEKQMIRSIWRIVRNEQDAEDAMQNALAILWKRWGRVCRHPNPQAVILKICTDTACDVARQRRRHQTRLKALSQEPEGKLPTPARASQNSELYDELIAAVLKLPQHQATATLMRLVQQQSYGDIAAALGCTEVTARKHVARGRERLRSALMRLNPNANGSVSL